MSKEYISSVVLDNKEYYFCDDIARAKAGINMWIKDEDMNFILDNFSSDDFDELLSEHPIAIYSDMSQKDILKSFASGETSISFWGKDSFMSNDVFSGKSLNIQYGKAIDNSYEFGYFSVVLSYVIIMGYVSDVESLDQTSLESTYGKGCVGTCVSIEKFDEVFGGESSSNDVAYAIWKYNEDGEVYVSGSGMAFNIDDSNFSMPIKDITNNSVPFIQLKITDIPADKFDTNTTYTDDATLYLTFYLLAEDKDEDNDLRAYQTSISDTWWANIILGKFEGQYGCLVELSRQRAIDELYHEIRINVGRLPDPDEDGIVTMDLTQRNTKEIYNKLASDTNAYVSLIYRQQNQSMYYKWKFEVAYVVENFAVLGSYTETPAVMFVQIGDIDSITVAIYQNGLGDNSESNNTVTFIFDSANITVESENAELCITNPDKCTYVLKEDNLSYYSKGYEKISNNEYHIYFDTYRNETLEVVVTKNGSDITSTVIPHIYPTEVNFEKSSYKFSTNDYARYRTSVAKYMNYYEHVTAIYLKTGISSKSVEFNPGSNNAAVYYLNPTASLIDTTQYDTYDGATLEFSTGNTHLCRTLYCKHSSRQFLTQEEYDKLSTKDQNKLYYILEG